MMSRLRSPLMVMSYCLVSLALFAPTTLADDLRGVVLDSMGQPAAGVPVQLTTWDLLAADAVSIDETTTDQDGRYCLAVTKTWSDVPGVYRQDLLLTVRGKGRENGGIIVSKNLPLPRHQLIVRLEAWEKRRISLRDAKGTPQKNVKVQLAGLQLPIIYPLRYSQYAERQLAGIPNGHLKTEGTTDESGMAELLLPPAASVGLLKARIQSGVSVTWMVVAGNEKTSSDWSTNLKIPELKPLPIQVTTGTDDLDSLSLSVTTTPVGATALRVTSQHLLNLDKDGKGTALIVENSGLRLANGSKKGTTHFVSPGWVQPSPTRRQLNVTFDKGVTVTGRAVATDGKPAANISLFVLNQAAMLKTSTDAVGRFSVATSAGHFVVLPSEGSGYRAEKMDPQSAIGIPKDSETHDVGDVVLLRFNTLTGVVRNDTGQSVSGARLTAMWDERGYTSPEMTVRRERIVFADAAGQFSIEGIYPNSDVTVTAGIHGAVLEQPQVVPADNLTKPLELTISSASCIAVSGRVTDATGAGAASVAVTLRHRMRTPLVRADLPIGEDLDGVTLTTDSDGNYSTSRVLPPWGDYLAVIRSTTQREANSGWKLAKSGERLVLPPIEEFRTRRVSGRVVTADGQPLGKAKVVLLTSNGQVEATSGTDGAFEFTAPAGRLPLVIAEADGYMTNGVPLSPNANAIEIVLPTPDELPLRSVNTARGAPHKNTSWTIKQKRELALKLIDGSPKMDPQTQMQIDSAIARAFPDRMLADEDSLPDANTRTGQRIRGLIAMGLAAARPQEGLRILDQTPEDVMKMMMMVHFASAAGFDDDARLQLLARIVQDARGVKEAQYRVITLGLAAERLLDMGHRESGEALLRETYEDAKKLAPVAWSAYARGAFAEEFAQVDVDAALELIEPIAGASEFNRHLQNVAHEIAALDPDRAITLLDRFRELDADARPITDARDAAVQRVCYRMVRVAPDKAIKLARTVKHDSMRVYGFCVMIESLLKKETVTDHDLELARELHDEAWQLLTTIKATADLSKVAWLYPSTMAGMLCRHTASLVPNELPHRVWQTIALRRPIEVTGTYRMAGQGCCCEIALLLAAVDRSLAEHVAGWLPDAAVGGQHFTAYMNFARPAAELIAELQPHRCEAVLEATSAPAVSSRLRLALIKALTRVGESSDRAIRKDMLLWFPDDEDIGPIE